MIAVHVVLTEISFACANLEQVGRDTVFGASIAGRIVVVNLRVRDDRGFPARPIQPQFRISFVEIEPEVFVKAVDL